MMDKYYRQLLLSESERKQHRKNKDHTKDDFEVAPRKR